MNRFRSLPLLLCLLVLPAQAAAKSAEIAWQPWSPSLFAQAKAEQKYVFLYLEAVWCHWCHVMQAQTFTDPGVQRTLAQNYIATRVDHDANPLLASRYRDYGWPALIVYAPDGTEIVKRAGYLAPDDFSRLLVAIVRDPSPESATPAEVAGGASALSAVQRRRLLQMHEDSYDPLLGGLRSAQKFVDRDSVEYALSHAERPVERIKAEKTLSAAMALLDPVWGGAYQYSTGGDWNHPHYEKIMRVQAGYLRIYALAYGRLRREQDRRALTAIRDYLFNFLRSPAGAFYVSQDADLRPGEKARDFFALNDAQRRQRGMPRIDRHLYADANGLAAEALAVAYQFTGDESALAAAKAAVQWTLKNRAVPGGGFRHGEEKAAGNLYLSDNLAMGRAFLQLYKVTAERSWLQRAVETAAFIGQKFKGSKGGLLAGERAVGPVQPVAVIEENIAAVRFLNLLAHYSGAAAAGELAAHAMQFLASDARIDTSFEEAGILMADEELAHAPAHLTVVGGKRDPAARALFNTALQFAGAYSRIEWLDASEGELPNSDVQYPHFPRPAGYVCKDRRCSAPRFSAKDYATAIGSLASG